MNMFDEDVKLTDPQRKLMNMLLNGWVYQIRKNKGVLVKNGYEIQCWRNKTMHSLLHLKLIESAGNNTFVIKKELKKYADI